MGDDQRRAHDDGVADAAHHQAVFDAEIAHHWPCRPFYAAEAGVGGFVTGDFNRADQADRSCLADQRVPPKLFGKYARQIGPGVAAGALDQAFTFDNLDVAQRDGGAHWMARVSEAVDEIAAGFEDIDNLRRYRARRNWQVSRRQPLGHRDHVGLDAHRFMAPHIARPAKAADDFIADEQDAVFAADRLNRWPIIGRRDDDAARALNWFTNKRRDVFGADAEDALLNRIGADKAESLLRHALALIIPVGLADMLDAGDGEIALRVHEFHAAKADARNSRSVVGVVAADEDFAVWLALGRPIMAHHAENCVIRLGTAGIEKHMRQAVLGEAGDLLREHHGGRRHRFEEGVVEGQFLHLLGGDLGEFRAAIADVDAPQPGHAVENAVAVTIIDVATVGMGDDAAAAHIFDQLVILLGGQMVRDVEAFEFSDIIIAWHGQSLQ